MRRILMVLSVAIGAVTLILPINAFCQDIDVPEPEFVGEVYVFNRENPKQYAQLMKERAVTRTSASVSTYLTGIGRATSKLVLKSAMSDLTIPNTLKYAFIVKAENNNYDPASLIQLIKFDVFPNERRSELSSVATWGTIKQNNKNYVPFSAKKYGESSYLIVADLGVGEYGFILSARDDINSVIATVSVFDQAGLDAQRAEELEAQRIAESREKVKQMEKEARKQKKKAKK